MSKDAVRKLEEQFPDILATEWSYRFEHLQKSAMITSFHKYGKVTANHSKDNNHMPAIENLKKRLERYLETGNTEFLVDVANFAMIEYMNPQHPNAHYKFTDTKDGCDLVGFGINQIKDELD